MNSAIKVLHYPYHLMVGAYNLGWFFNTVSTLKVVLTDLEKGGLFQYIKYIIHFINVTRLGSKMLENRMVI